MIDARNQRMLCVCVCLANVVAEAIKALCFKIGNASDAAAHTTSMYIVHKMNINGWLNGHIEGNLHGI